MESLPSLRIRCRLVGEPPDPGKEFFFRTTVTYSHRVMEIMTGQQLDPKVELLMYDGHMYKREEDEWRLLDGPA